MNPRRTRSLAPRTRLAPRAVPSPASAAVVVKPRRVSLLMIGPPGGSQPIRDRLRRAGPAVRSGFWGAGGTLPAEGSIARSEEVRGKFSLHAGQSVFPVIQ